MNRRRFHFMGASVLWAVVGLAASLSTTACDPTEACTSGAEGCACMEDSCVGDLVCRSGACVNFIRFVLESGDGCELAVEAHSLFTPQGRLEIQGLRFTADSQCPDFPDIAEGVYEIGATDLMTDGSGIAGELEVPDRNSAESCVAGDYHIFLAGTLDGGIDNLLVKPTELVISGAFDSFARDESCPSF